VTADELGLDHTTRMSQATGGSLLALLARHAAESLPAAQAGVVVQERIGADEPVRLVAVHPDEVVEPPPAALAVAREAIADGRARPGSNGGRFTRAGCVAAAPFGFATDGPGALWVAAADPREFDEGDVAQLEGLAAIAGAALARRPDALLERPISAAVAAMAALLDLRDGYAAADAEEMVQLGCAIGRRLSMSRQRLDELELAARLHDIGKIGVPDRILHKPGRLEPEELLIVQRHPVWGAETLRRIPALAPIAAIVRAHHERWDGKGYPAGLAGDATPLASRIIGFCEAYRAVTSERPYRRSLDQGQALTLVLRASETHFDPDVVAAGVEVLGQRGVRPHAPVDAGARGDAAPPSGTRGYGHNLRAAFERVESLPAFAESRDRLVALFASELPDVGEMVAIIESDPALVLALLRVVNRRAAKGDRVSTVPDAIKALKPEAVEMLVSRIPVVDFFERPPAGLALPAPERAHAIAVQRAARRIAREAGSGSRDELLVASLLHDVGKLVLAVAVQGYPSTIHGEARTPDQRVLAERHALGLDHAAVGAVLLRRSGAPESLIAAVEGHHAREPGPAAAIIGLADLLVHHQNGQPIDTARVRTLAGRIGLSRSQMRSLMFELPGAGGAGEERTIEPCPLSAKELEVMRLLAQGMQYKQIATELGTMPSTVRSHMYKAYQRLGVSDRAQAVLLCAKRGWL
jgi:putative nucleotidyltransferase with HDIG domain